ncbi:solute carrier family 23 protein [Niveispirillum sp.]|uniref:solute carrier family 23 protein n=1 Tax=Niveispirillum sp. TaxID=1917217 RepID=UPI001B70C4FC|nr:solute carrier family 23 protein [Niveispirillum sp.]MBP7338669.1 hypothetical protein [Niveispirillum sp.]
MRKPDNIVYWLNDRLPPRVALLLALQQVAFLSVLLLVPSLYSHMAHLPPEAFLNLASATLLTSAAGVLLQAWGRFGIGSGYYYPVQATTTVLATLALAASRPGGLPAAYGMIAVIGLSQLAFSFVIVRLRSIITVEVAGLAVALIGIGLGQMGLALIFDLPQFEHGTMRPSGLGLAAAAGCFAIMAACHVWGSGQLRLFTMLLGLVGGVLLSWFLGLLTSTSMAPMLEAPYLRLPDLPVFGWAFDAGALLPYIITGFLLALSSIGTQALMQRANDADWVRPDLRSLGHGVRAEGVMHLVAALLNGLPLLASGGGASLAASTGCTSRHLAYWTAGLLALFAFIPKLIMIWLVIPNPVAGALLLFLSCTASINGIRLITSRLLDNRRIIAVGTGLLVGLTGLPLLEALVNIWSNLHYLAFSSVSAGMLTCVLLATLFRLGEQWHKTARFSAVNITAEGIADFIEAQGRAWGARVTAVRRAEHASWQAIELLRDADLIDPARPELELATEYDDYFLTIIFRYQGQLVPLEPSPPTADEMLEDPEAGNRMAGFLIRKLALQAQSRRQGAMAELRLRFAG